MNELYKLFPANDFSLIALILGLPLLGAFVNGVWGRRLGKPAVRLMALVAVGGSFVASVFAFVMLSHAVDATSVKSIVDGHEVTEHAHAKLSWLAWDWMTTTGSRGSSVPIQLKFSIDALSGVMMLVVTGVGFLIHLYSTSYMAEDKAFWRFFAYLNLFIFSMLVLILGDNLPVLFIGWEGVGLCSYLLIGFWYTKMPNAAAGKKAFIANRIGDFGLIVGMFLLVHYTGALDWAGIENNASSLITTSEGSRVHLWPIGGGQFPNWLHFLQPNKVVTISAATAVALALFLGCTGKSAQIPLYVWLPDAMAGPTPVSALIHAATMVTAGVYLVCRMSFVFVLSPGVMMIIAFTGAATALLAASIALVQNDIKKVLAYSTVSQLGYMFMGVGVGAFTAGFFHVFTHAFFKACLFLGSGSVIHAMHARVHDDAKAQDMRNMGGLRKWMPITYWTFVASTLAIIGFPLTSGFFSKDEILFRAFVDHDVNPYAQKVADASKGHFHLYEPPQWIGTALWLMGIAAAAMTAFYMCRVVFMTFWGDFRGWVVGRPSLLAREEIVHEDDHHDAHGDGDDDDEDAHHDHHEEDLSRPAYPPHESPWQMTVPLIILATAAIIAGVFNAELLKHILPLPMEHWLDPVFADSTRDSVKIAGNAEAREWPLTAAAFAAFAVGSGLSYWMYVMQKGEPAKRAAEAAPGLYRLLLDKWRVDELYAFTVVNLVDSLAETCAWADQTIIDGILARLTALITTALGTALRMFQTGVVHVYAAIMVVGLTAFGYFFVQPHADGIVKDNGNGDYVVEAAPGLGYGYHWSTDINAKPTAEMVYTGDAKIKVHLEQDKSQTVRLDVVNSFGFHTSRDFKVTRPAEIKPIEVGQN